MRNLKGLEEVIDFTSVHWYMDLGGVSAFINSDSCIGLTIARLAFCNA
jgi:glutathionyl-hydroquinone reductase